MDYYLSLGSNVGDRYGYLQRAIKKISEFGKIKKISSVYETSPVGVKKPQDMYLNMVIAVSVEKEPIEMLKIIKRIEQKMGRDIKYSHLKPRKIDIDILFCDDLIINTKSLKIPHKEIEKRRFVLIPLSEIEPELLNPLTGISARKMLRYCVDNGYVNLVKKK